MASTPKSPGIRAEDGIGDWRLLECCNAIAGQPVGTLEAAVAALERFYSATSLTADEMRRYFVATPTPKPDTTQPAYTQLAAFKRAQSRRYVK